MAKINKEMGMVSAGRSVTITDHNKVSVEPLKPESSRAAESKRGRMVITHQMIEERAREIWRQKGAPVGQDESNWFEAEAQLRKEYSSR